VKYSSRYQYSILLRTSIASRDIIGQGSQKKISYKGARK
jgi:hypothetical protein